LSKIPHSLEQDRPTVTQPKTQLDVSGLAHGLRGRYTVIIVTHNLAQARRMADHVALFWSVNGIGQLIETGSAQNLFEFPQHELTAAYISGARG